MAKIVCDTDFLIKIANDPIPKFDWGTLSKQNEFCTLPSVVRELKGLLESEKSVTRRRARMALAILGTSNASKMRLIEDVQDFNRETDQDLFDFVRKSPEDRMVASLDRSLLSKLERRGMPYITLSSGRAFIHNYSRAIHLSQRKSK